MLRSSWGENVRYVAALKVKTKGGRNFHISGWLRLLSGAVIEQVKHHVDFLSLEFLASVEVDFTSLELNYCDKLILIIFTILEGI